MSDQYVPTTEEARDYYALTACAPNKTYTEGAAEFDRWLNSIKAGAWEMGALWAAAECGVIEPDCPPEQWLTPGDNPYRKEQTDE